MSSFLLSLEYNFILLCDNLFILISSLCKLNTLIIQRMNIFLNLNNWRFTCITCILILTKLIIIIITIASNSRTRKSGKKSGDVKGKYGRIWWEEERNADYGGMVQPSQQHVASCVKMVEWGLGTRGLIIVAAFWDKKLIKNRSRKYFHIL